MAQENITIHRELEQRSDEWYAARCGILTASAMSNLLTPATLKPSKSMKAYCDELISQKITDDVEDTYQSYDMMRGSEQEHIAKEYYSKRYELIEDVGFITNDKLGFPIGYSPDGLVGLDGSVEVKAPKRKSTIDAIITQEVPREHFLQCQTGLFVSERKWLDFISYSNGLFMGVIRVYPDEVAFAAIETAAIMFNDMMLERMELYKNKAKEFDYVQTEVITYEPTPEVKLDE